MIEAVIFDFDGIIADTEDLHYESYQAVLAPRGLGFSYDEYADRYMAFDSLDCFRQRIRDLHHAADEQDLQNWLVEKNDAYATIIATREIHPLPGALDAMAHAASNGPVAICTGAVLNDIAPLLNRFDIRNLLTAIVTADDVTVSKPDPESYRLACSRLGKDPAVCLAIEDTPGGLRSAKGAGCRTLGVTTTHTAAQLSPVADHVIATLVGWTLSANS
jgi:beta-phosphoglucomutase